MEPTAAPLATAPPAGIDPDKLAITLEVLGQLHELPPDHADIQTVKRATSYMWKLLKKSRRAEIRLEKQAHDHLPPEERPLP